MRVFYIHQYFKTPEEGGAIRSWYLSTALAERGISVDVITTHNKKEYQKKQLDGVVVHYLPVRYDNTFGFMRRIMAFMIFVIKAVKLMKKLKKPDLCYATSTPLTVGLAARWLKRYRNVPYYFEVRDLWPEAPIEMGYFRDPLSRAFVRYLEKLVYRSADKIVCLSPGIKEYVAKLMPDKPLYLIPNMSDTDFFVPSQYKMPEANNTLTISYIGAVGPVNHLEYLLDIAAASMEAHIPVLFNVAGEGSKLEYLKQIAKDKCLDNVSFVGRLDRGGVREMLENSDVVYISFKNIPVLETNSPNKYFEALAAGKMCVVNSKGWIADMLEHHRAGFYSAPSNPYDFVRKIEPFIRDATLLRSYQENARLLATEQFSRKQLSEAFYHIITGEQRPSKINKELAYILNP